MSRRHSELERVIERDDAIGTWDWDLASGELVWSEPSRRIVGLALDAPRDYGRFLELVPADERERHTREVERALSGEGDGAFHCEHRIVRPDGQVRWVSSYGRVIYDGSGQPLRVLGTIVDVTERVDEERRALALRDRVLSIVSHDLRTPLTAIDLGGAVLIELVSKSGNSILQRQLEMIRRNAARMGRLIADLVDMASLQAGRLGLATQVVPLTPWIAEALAASQRTAAERGITLACAAPLEAVCPVDRERMVRALGALIAAALERTPAGGAVTVRARVVDDEAHIAVLDTGAALGPDEVRILFELVGGPRRAVGRSAGTLFVARGIVEAHGGRLEVASEAGRGNVFTLALPLTLDAGDGQGGEEPA